jgi:peptidylprolyl isomerase
MKRRRFATRLAGIGGLACLGLLMFASPCAAYTPPETNPRIVLSTPHGPILIALAPENAPKHVEQFLLALAAGDFNGTVVTRVEPQYYVQMAGRPGTAQLAGLPVEREKVGNLRGAFSVYDSGQPGDIPTLVIVLVSSPQLDPDYTSIGFVEAGFSVVKGIAEAPTVGDRQPAEPITISEIHLASLQERAVLRQAEVNAVSNEGTSLLAAIFIVACAAFMAAVISSFQDRLGRQRSMSLALMVGLLAFFGVWVALAGTKEGSGLIGAALFGGAIAMFRLMGRFERPAPSKLGLVAEPRQLADGELHVEPWIDQPQSDLEVVLGQRDAAAGRLTSSRR